MHSQLSALRRAVLVVALALSAGSPLRAADLTPVGRWVTYSHKTNAPNGIIEIALDHGALKGTVVQMLNRPAALPAAVCRKCEGALKNAPVVGLTIMWGLKKTGDGSWDAGSILDPNTGNVYSARIELEDGGQKLLVRGYLGISLLGRTEVWLRQS
jgi:uncharacterized protein (DUF2147 family)